MKFPDHDIYLIVYPCKWSLRTGSTNNDFGGSSHISHNAAALSAAKASSPGGNGMLFWTTTKTNFVHLPDKAVLMNKFY